MIVKKNGAKLFVECLQKQGVEVIYAIPGAKIDALFDALKDSSIKLVLCRHEQNACFQAQSYGRLTGKPGVVLVTSGPGVSNLVTGLLTATTEGDPLVAIGGNVPRSMRLKKSHQACDNVKLTEAATKSSQEIMMVESIPEVIQNAFRDALEPRSGAVFISLPQDISLETTTIEASLVTPQPAWGQAPSSLIHEAALAINQAKNPLILLGTEASRPDNTAAIRALIAKTHIAVLSTYQAAGVISKDLYEYFVGRVGLFRNQPGDELIEHSDLVITIGYNSVEYDPEIWNLDSEKRKIIHIDYIKADIHRTYTPCVELLGDVKSNVSSLASLVIPRPKAASPLVAHLKKELETILKEGDLKNNMPIHPLKFISELRKIVDDQTLVTCDVGSHYMWMARYFYVYEPHQLLFSNGQQTLGVALPWAMAAKLVHPKKKVISISGDGGFLFSAQELETAVREKLHVIHCIWVDHTYNMVQEQQMLKYHRDCCVHFGGLDVQKFAESFGAHGLKITSANDIAETFQKAFTIPGPVLIEVPIDYSDNMKLFESALDLDL